MGFFAGTVVCLIGIFLAGCSSEGSGAPAPSEEGGVYFCSDRGGNFEVYRQHDGQLEQLTDDGMFDTWWPRQSPDGGSLLFYRTLISDRPPTGGANNNYDDAALWSLDLQSQVSSELIGKDANGWASQGVVDWSPDGARLVMAVQLAASGRWHLIVSHPDGSSPVQITSRDSLFLDPSWSPDGTQIVYTAFPPAYGGVDLAFLEIYKSDANGLNEVRLTNDGLRDHDPYWSPSGTQIAFETAVDPAFAGGIGKWAIRLMASDGSSLHTVLDDGHINTLPRWSEDGNRLLFHRFEFGSGHGFIVASMAVDGSDYRDETSGGAYDDSDLDWFRLLP